MSERASGVQFELSFDLRPPSCASLGFTFLSSPVLSARLLKSQSADSLLNSDMDTAPPQAAPSNHTWLDGVGQAGAKDTDAASSAHSNQNSPQTHDAYLSLLTNKGIATNLGL